MMERPRSKVPFQPSPLVTEKMRIDRYNELKQRIEPITIPQETAKTDCKEIFSMTITGSTKTGGDMDQVEEPQLNEQFLIDLIFKPNEKGLRLRPAETQLLLAYIGEILKEIELEEQMMIEEAKAKSQQVEETPPCK